MTCVVCLSRIEPVYQVGQRTCEACEAFRQKLSENDRQLLRSLKISC